MTTENKTDLDLYSAAMLRGDYLTCVYIEEEHDLLGYPPEVVTVGLKAVAEGKDPNAAIENYMKEAKDDNQ